MGVRPLEVWGGLECTIARVRDGQRNQIEETGHAERPQDLEAIRSLGIEALRYPVLMETVAPESPDDCDWRWTDERLALIRRLGLRPIAGLLHHGSGPRYTSLLHANLPDLLAGYAAKVARRYPWIDRFTPVNEPLTTARFSALYGHWYPHAADFGRFLQALVIQCKATVLAMRAIRQVNPDAQLIQTEDIGKSFGTPVLQAQVAHENERRWLSLDLLCGRVNQRHPLYRVLRDHGIPEGVIDFFREADAAPDVIGVNHYLTSERYLDENLDRYPGHLHGGNGRQVYADAEAVRVAHLPAGVLGPAARLREVWTRYGRPLAVTEVHHGCTRDEQLRWLLELWNAAKQLRQEGVDIRAVTPWALLGAYDWNSLLTGKRGSYEPGAFDIRAPAPRPTALAVATRSLARSGTFSHPVLDGHGWWRRAERCYGAMRALPENGGNGKARPLLICGGFNPLAEVFARICEIRGLHCETTAHGRAGTTDQGADLDLLASRKPWAVIDTGLDPCATLPDDRARAAARASGSMARACAKAGLRFVTFSSDQVFDGGLERPYDEGDEASPAGFAGRLLLEHEQTVAAVHPAALIVRTGMLLNAWDVGNFGVRLLSRIINGRLPSLANDVVSPTYAPDLAHAVLDLLIDGETGIWHLPNQGRISMVDLTMRLASDAGLRRPVAAPVGQAWRDFGMGSRRGWPMPTLDDALFRFGRDALLERKSGALLAAE